MLEAIREGTRGWIAWVIIAILIIPFALWGVGNYAGFISHSYVAEVNGADITQRDLNEAVQGRVRQLRQVHGQNYEPDDRAKLKKHVLDNLIGSRVLEQHALDAGYRVGDQQLLERIHSMHAFNVGGKFNVDVYRIKVKQAGYTPQGFENLTRRNMAVRQLQAGIGSSALVTQPQFDQFVALANEQRNLSYVTIEAKRYLGAIKPSNNAIAAYYNKHKQSFMKPATVKIAYIELDADKLGGSISVSDKKLHSLYGQKKGSLVKQAQRKAAHILISPKNDSAAALKKAKATANSVLKKIHHGGSFATLAKKYSDDPGSAKKGGELGWVGRGDLVKPFEKALFGIGKVGKVVGPVKSRYGFHIIKLEGIRKPRQKTFKEARAKLAKDYRAKKAKDKYFELGDKLGNLAFAHQGSLEPIHQALDLPIRHIDGVTRKGGKGIATNEKIRSAAFSSAVYDNGKNKVVQLADTHVVVLRDVDRKPASLKPLKEARPKIAKTLKQRAAAAKAKKVARRIVNKVDKGQKLDDAAGDLKVHSPGWVKRGGSDVPAPITAAAFKSPAQKGRSSAHVVGLQSGNQAVYTITGVKSGNPSSIKDDHRKMMKRRLARARATEVMAAYAADLRAKADVDVEKKNLSRDQF
jgi:peptidyl-prolyl cis-trans isomerase D